MLLIYYNTSYGFYYLKYVRHYHNFMYKVGYTDQFGHIIVQAFYIDGGGMVQVNSYEEYMHTLNQTKTSLRNRIINQAIGLLDKLKNKKED